MMTIVVNVLVEWIEHKVKGNRYDAQRWTRKKRCRKRKDIRSNDYRGEKGMKWKVKKKTPLPDAECPFFSESVVSRVLCRRQRLSFQLSNLHVNMKERPALKL